MYCLQMNTSIILFDLVTKGNLVVYYMYFTPYISLTLGRVVVVVWWLDLQLPM